MSIDRLTAALSDRYRFDRELGQGGMATVYLAHDLRHERDVAIKVLHADLGAALGPERFLSEIRTTARLQHPHILPLLDSGEADGLLYYVMPLVTGETLRARLDRERQLPVDDAVRVAREVADALHYAHGHGVIHRDIKPENILLQDGHALVADFGIALAVQQAGGARMTQTGLSLGTPQYMSPEQAMGERSIDARSDVYALAAITYEMLVGEPPFTGPSVQAIVARVMTEEPRGLSIQRRAIPEQVENAVLHGLEKLPADRFATAAEFAAALATGSGALRSATARHTAARTTATRTRWRDPVVIGLATVALASLAWTGWSRSRTTVPDAPVMRFDVNLPPGYTPYLASANGPDLAISDDGMMLAYPVANPQGVRQIYVRRLDQSEGRLLEGTDDGYTPHFTADGSALVFWAAGRHKRVALDGGAPQAIASGPGIGSNALSPDGSILVAFLQGGPIYRMAAPGYESAPAAPLDSAQGEMAQHFPLPLPDGRYALYASWGTGGIEDARIGLLDLDRGVARRLNVQGTYPLGILDGNLVYSDLSGTILAIPLDLKSGKVTGQPVVLVSGVTTAGRASAVAALSPTGTLVYQGGSQVSTLVLANAAGERALPIAAGLYAYPRYSPDGSKVALTVASGASSDVWIADVASGAPTRLTSGGSVNERPEWSPGGNRVLFRTVRDAGSALWWQQADGSGPATPLLTSDTVNYFEGVITPDGANVVFQADNGQSDVMMQRLDGKGPPIAIAISAASESQARVSPDGRWVVYVSGESDRPEVVVQPLSGDGSRTQVSIRGGIQPVWSRDGRRIFYRAEGTFVVAEVSSTPTFRVTSRADFLADGYVRGPSPHANYDVTPDGRSLLVLEGEPQRLQVVANWGAEVRALLRAGATRR